MLFTVKDLSIFYVIVIMRALSCIIVCFVKDSDVDYYKARGLTATQGSSSSAMLAPIPFLDVMRDGYVVVFLITVCLFHFANAAMLPLLSQKMFLDNTVDTLAVDWLLIARVCLIC